MIGSVSVAVVMPAHNEDRHIADVLRCVPSYVDKVYVVDDASTDSTARIVGLAEDSRIHLERLDSNRGVGGAMQVGYQLALAGGHDLIAKVDADGQMDMSEMIHLVTPLLQDAGEYAKGNRFYFAGATSRMPRERSLGNSLLTFMTKLASGYWHVYDSQCGFTVIKSSYLKLLGLENLPEDYFFENAMLIELNRLGARVIDVPITTIYGTEVSGISLARVIRSFPPRLASAAVRRIWRKHFVTDFGAMGALISSGVMLAGFGLAFGAFHWWRSITTGVPASTGTVMLAALPIMLGAQVLVQAFALGAQSSPGATETLEYVRNEVGSGSIRQSPA